MDSWVPRTYFNRNAPGLLPRCSKAFRDPREWRLRRALSFSFTAYLIDFDSKLLVLTHFDHQKPQCKTAFFLQAARRQKVHVGGLVVAVLEVGGLDPSLSNQRLHAIIHFSKTDSQLAGDIALT